MTDEELMHYGKVGMKWGVRKSSSSRRIPATKDFITARELKKKKVHQLTNDEISTLTKRMELEKKFSQLNPSAIKRGQAKVNDIMSVVSTVATVVNSPVGRILIKNGKAILAKAK